MKTQRQACPACELIRRRERAATRLQDALVIALGWAIVHSMDMEFYPVIWAGLLGVWAMQDTLRGWWRKRLP